MILVALSAHVLIGQQRKRAGFTGTMADLAILLDDWRDVLRVGGDIHRARGRGRLRAGHFAELAAPAATAINATIITTRVRRLLMVPPPSI